MLFPNKQKRNTPTTLDFEIVLVSGLPLFCTCLSYSENSSSHGLFPCLLSDKIREDGKQSRNLGKGSVITIVWILDYLFTHIYIYINWNPNLYIYVCIYIYICAGPSGSRPKT